MPRLSLSRILVSTLCILAPAFPQQVITTVAGTDWIFPGDGKPAVQAPLGGLLAMGVAADRDGNFYIADQDNFMVMKVTPDGILHVVAGNGLLGYSGDGGPATSASMGLPVGVAVDAAGSLYIVDAGLSIVRKVSPDGTISTIAGINATPGYAGDDSPATSALLNLPSSIAVDGAGNVYIGDEKNHRV